MEKSQMIGTARVFLDYTARSRHQRLHYSQEQLEKLACATESLPGLLFEVEGVAGCLRNLDWDTQIFGLPCARLDWVVQVDCAPSVAAGERVLDQLPLDEGIHIRTRILLADLPLAWAIERHGFRLMGSNVTLRTMVTSQEPRPVELATKEETQAIGELAAVSFVHNQYGSDPQLHDCTGEMHRQWAINACNGRADVVIVRHEASEVAGFISCQIDHHSDLEPVGVIDLLAVDPAYRGRGIGEKLVADAMSWFGSRVGVVEVGTQTHNYAAQSIYRKHGFKELSHNLIFHRPAKL